MVGCALSLDSVRIAILGTRGIPACYGGVETFAGGLLTRLGARGHDVCVYTRQRHPSPCYRGVQLRYLPTIRHKYFETVAHTFLSTLHLMAHRTDAAVYTWMPRMAGVRVALNVDGLERKRKKWNWLARTWYLVSEHLATVCPNVVVSDAEGIASYYQKRYRKRTQFIPYGAETGKTPCSGTLARLGLEPGRYFLYVSRMEPENNALLVREAFEGLETDMKLALVGDAPYAESYIARVRQTSDPRIVMPGAIYGDGYHELQSHSFAYIHATEVGGTHPALIEAMGRGALVLYLNTPENAEVGGRSGIPFEHSTLRQAIEKVLRMPDQERNERRREGMARITEWYSWDAVTLQYEALLGSLAGQR